MSSPQLPDLGAILGNVFNAIVGAFTAVVNFLSSNIGTIITIVILVSVVGLAFMMVKRFGKGIVNTLKGLLPF